MSTSSLCILAAFAAAALLIVASIAVERATRRVGAPLGVPPPTGRCSRCDRANLALDRWGRPLPHYPHSRAPLMCPGPRRVR